MSKWYITLITTLILILSNTSNSQASTTDPNELIFTAKQYIGVPYVWGGATPGGFDCSGFLNYVFKKHGIILPRTAAEMYEKGQPIKEEQLEPGDLVFFETYKPGASHAGIYLGGTSFIHSSSSNGVSVSSLTNTYWKNRYIGAKRFIEKLGAYQYYDVSSAYWAYSAIYEFSKKEHIKGYPGHKFYPENQITRAEAASIIANIENYIVNSDETIIFKDVSLKHWGYNPIRAMFEKGVFVGDENGNFNPSDPLTRAQMAVIIDRIYEFADAKEEKTFVDVGGTHWANESIKHLAGNNMINGFPDGTFRPDESTTRAQFVAVLNRIK